MVCTTTPFAPHEIYRCQKSPSARSYNSRKTSFGIAEGPFFGIYTVLSILLQAVQKWEKPWQLYFYSFSASLRCTWGWALPPATGSSARLLKTTALLWRFHVSCTSKMNQEEDQFQFNWNTQTTSKLHLPKFVIFIFRDSCKYIILNSSFSSSIAPEHAIEPVLTLLKRFARQLSRGFTTKPCARIQICLCSHCKEYFLPTTMRGRSTERAQYAGTWELSEWERERRRESLMRELVLCIVCRVYHRSLLNRLSNSMSQVLPWFSLPTIPVLPRLSPIIVSSPWVRKKCKEPYILIPIARLSPSYMNLHCLPFQITPNMLFCLMLYSVCSKPSHSPVFQVQGEVWR